MIVGQSGRGEMPVVEVVTGTSFALLVALARASREPRDGLEAELARALDELGDPVGETWLNLLGIPLDAGPPHTVDRLLGVLEAIDPVELRRHLLGRYAWSWCTLVGIDDIEAAASGDSAASRRLLAHPRYYGTHARDSLTVLVALEPEETRRRIRRAVDAGARTLIEEGAAEALEIAEARAAAALTGASPLEAIERVALGYRYIPEPEAERVLLIPHLEPGLSLVLAQHRAARLMAFRAKPAPGSEQQLVALGRALADPKRIEILGLLARGVQRASDLVDETGLSRSTVHYHLSQLREAGLITLEGNARAYRYATWPAAAESLASLLADVIGFTDSRTNTPREGKEGQ